MTAPTESRSRPSRLTIAGASSLRGKELKLLLEESSVLIEDLRLLDEEFAAGILSSLRPSEQSISQLAMCSAEAVCHCLQYPFAS